MTKEQADSTPILDLPLSIQANWQTELQRVSDELSTSVEELMKLSKNEIKLLIKKKSEADREARLAKIRKEHQAIYDQKPNWLDMNICPKPDVIYCNNVGQNVSVVSKWYPDEIYEYGKILGVVWRSKGSIVSVSGGNVDYNWDPKIFKASEAQYFYIAKDNSGIIELVVCKSATTKF